MTANTADRDNTQRRLIIDSELCQGHGRCVAFLPHRIEFDELGCAVVTDPVVDDDGEVPRVRIAVDNCPERAVSLC
jgi:ferredoxin